MKFNEWTKGLAAAGIVSLASAAQAQVTANPVVSAVADVTVSGYVDTSAQWNIGTGNANNPRYAFSQGKADGFNLNVAQISLSKALDEKSWAAGYRVDLWVGPDAGLLGSSVFDNTDNGATDFAVRQANVQLRTPVGMGDLTWKLGVFDTVIGYESLTGANNPHYTRSYGFTLEPTTHTGLLGTYQANDYVGLSAGIADSVGPYINGRSFGGEGDAKHYTGTKAESYKTYMASLALTAPDSWGFIKGSSLYGGLVNGFSPVNGATHQCNYYLGATVATPVSGLKFGLSFDNLDIDDGQDVSATALYGSMQVTEKLTFLARAEYLKFNANSYFNAGTIVDPVWLGNTYALTLTAQYDLWENVLSRVEFRWDHAEHHQLFGGDTEGAPNRENALLFAGNVVYKF